MLGVRQKIGIKLIDTSTVKQMYFALLVARSTLYLTDAACSFTCGNIDQSVGDPTLPLVA